MEYDIHRAVRDVCLWLPEAEEFLSHGSPNFRVRGKTFVTYVVNHHGDGRVALWLNAARGERLSRQRRSRSEPSCATEATSVPSCLKIRPRVRPRAPCALGESWA